LFAGDQKIEHLNSDFFGAKISKDDADPEHLFKIASKSNIGVFATQFGLVSMYGSTYKKVPFLIKLNSKTDLVKTKQAEPFSNLLVDVQDVVKLKNDSKLNILGVGYTIYLGSEFEEMMLEQASKAVRDAHENGLIAVLWIYPRGKAVKDEKDPHLIAGATGVAACLGADFVKVSYPEKKGKSIPDYLKEAVLSAGRTKVICAGGASTDAKEFLKTIHDQIHIAGAGGNATGRNVHQKDLKKAVKMCNAISAITFENKSVNDAMKIYVKK
ncbi:MAG: aldolase, partial [Candidatus Diapherotrites archaeon]|nr:aldolase [Candidatus Diapherotrites archaeon]